MSLGNTDLAREFSPLNTDLSLSKLLKSSNVFEVAQEDGFSRDQVEDLFKNTSLGSYLIFEFVYGMKNSFGETFQKVREWLKSGNRPVILGLGAGKMSELYSFGGALFSGDTWQNAYNTLAVDREDPNHTELFMQRITDEKYKYKPIIFFIPTLFQRKHQSAMGPVEGGEDPFSVTYKEFLFFLKNPDKAKNVIFLFGGTEYIDENFRIKNSGEDEQPRRYLKYFEAIRKLLNPGQIEQKNNPPQQP